MKILVLTKRQYTGKDLLDDRFGRFRELPLELAGLGHEVYGLCLSYLERDEASIVDSAPKRDGQVKWQSVNLKQGFLPALPRYFRQARQLISDFKPDIIWAGSDAYHCIFAARLAKEFTTRYVIDLYDNFESFGATRVPGILPLFKRAVRSANGVTCVSRPLAGYIRDRYKYQPELLVLGNAIRPDMFHPLDKIACREQLGLPDKATIIGTAGALDKSRGTETLYGAYRSLAAADVNLHLAIAGPGRRNDNFPRSDRVHDLGQLAHHKVASFINALDVAVVCNRDTAFGRYNFPQKAPEILACGTPIVAASVGAMQEILRDYSECLFTPDDPASLAGALRRQIEQPTRINDPIPSWTDMAVRLEEFFKTVLQDQVTGR